MEVRLMVLDVDGVLTDGKLYKSEDGREIKTFHTQDGLGIRFAQANGLDVTIISGRVSVAVENRAKELKIEYVYQGIKNKVAVLNRLLSELSLGLEQVCYIGDDWNDLPVMNKVGYPCAPANAVELVKQQAVFVTGRKGGEGAVREVIEHLLEGKINELSVLRYLEEEAAIVQ
ncbi:KdsC family phosphatase [Alkalihalobacillus pseudalcaliphilus]|uniref:KdsC family phosphatase n=1 Tax=Alkalihalobacillus pseudalcaliphilus TaxID=79884 RepID=UPI00064DCEC3|nr:HAD-IIIA family hydrolase [Alkalihalobacillus pseudalcaliphilus]KMK77393.1 3-deoxy-D-manno-octulosonate 8-phosphate phosphatase [Alkalihalobacillus pseudalcaliphilus]